MDYEIGKKVHKNSNRQSAAGIRVYEDDVYHLSLGSVHGWDGAKYTHERLFWLGCHSII